MKKYNFIAILVIFLFPMAFYPQNFTRITQGNFVTGRHISSGACWGDINDDGYLDVFIPNAKWNHNQLYLNDGIGGFIEVINSPVVSDSSDSKGGTFGDFDNDGDLDLFVANEEETNFFYINDGTGIFTKVLNGILVTDGDSASSHTCSWADYNNDGYLDIFIPNHRYNGNDYGQSNFLYQNNSGDGTFTKITQGQIVTDIEFSLSGNWADYDNDGDLDLFVANSGPSTHHNDNNSLYQNNGNGTFTKITQGSIVNDGGDSRTGSWVDYNNDGYLDLYVVNRQTSHNVEGYNFLYTNNGDGTFTKITNDPVVTDYGSSYSCSWGDFDNDGDLDLFVANRRSPNFLYANNGDGTFNRITTGPVAMDSDDSKGSTWIDFDNDGDLDLFVANYNYYENNPFNNGEENALYQNGGNNNNWINIECQGIVSNRSAIGAKVRIKAVINSVPVWQLNEISGQTSGGFCAQNSLNAEFGLGNATIIDSIKIEWPSGLRWDSTNVAVNHFLVIVEDSETVSINEEFANLSSEFLLKQNYPNPFNPSTKIPFFIPKRSHVSLIIYNILGEFVYELVNKKLNPGLYNVQWNGFDYKNKHVPSGIYIYKLKTEIGSTAKRMILMR
jgi:hypothetical protein